jgi:ABC-2 type transport system ATP-binding protein
MIQVEHLTKRYAGHTAVTDVSFEVGRGEIVGLLGPNGAGKSTIMRILSCFMPASSGTVRVAGFDVFTQADEVRRHIGYMPENNPLHKEMRVLEYLKFRTRLKGLSNSQSHERIGIVMDRCALTEVSGRIIGQLSKGYQQRVGLADALVHQPELIILDEPTQGLDPNQIRAVRQLIKDLGRQHTILLSSHILPEVEMTCTRVLILHRGRILAAGAPETLQQEFGSAGQMIAEIAAPAAELEAAWEHMPEIEHHSVAAAEGDYQRCTLTPRPGVDPRPLIHRLAVERGWPLRELTRARASLEDVFVRVTRTTGEEEEEL